MYPERLNFFRHSAASPRDRRARGLSLAYEHTVIDGFTPARYRLEVELITANLDEHETTISIESGCHVPGHLKVMAAQSSRVSQYEVIDPVLRLQALIQVFVPGEYRVNAILKK